MQPNFNAKKRAQAAQRMRRWGNKVVEKTCCECGRRYQGLRRLEPICSEKCKKARRRRFRPQTFKRCEHCGERFGPVGRLNVRFCSYRCGVEGRRGKPTKQRGVKRPERRRARVGTCLTCGGEYRARMDFKDRRQIYCSHRCYLVNRRVSHFEDRVFAFLGQHGIVCDRGAKVGRWTFDGRIVGTNILIEADGVYWHSLPEIVERDQRKNAWCAANGYQLIRVAEVAFEADQETACVSILAAREP